MAQMVFPPGNWSQTVNTADSIVLEYTSTYSNVNLTLYCEAVKGSGSWVKWFLPGPLPAKGTFNLHLSSFAFTKYINVWPTACHFDLTNSRDAKQVANGGNIPLTSRPNAAATTWSRSTTSTGTTRTSSIQTLSSPTGMSTLTSKTATSTQPIATATVTAEPTKPTGISKNAKIGIGAGAGAGGLLLIMLAVWAILIYRKRRRTQTHQATDTHENLKFEKAELLGDLVSKHGDSHTSHSNSPSQGSWGPSKYSNPEPDPPQELSAATPLTTGLRGQRDDSVRYELAA